MRKRAVRQGPNEEFFIQKRITDLGFDFTQGNTPCTKTGEFPVSVVGETVFFKLRCFPLS